MDKKAKIERNKKNQLITQEKKQKFHLMSSEQKYNEEKCRKEEM